MEDLKKGNICFLKSLLVDLIYVIKCQQGEVVTARKLDAPPNQWEELAREKLVKLADEQEKLLPSNLTQAIEEQRRVVFSPPKKGKKKGVSLEKQMKRLSKEGLDEILDALAGINLREEGGE